MVRSSAKTLPLAGEPIELPEEELRWGSVRLEEVLQRESRLKAAVFGIEGPLRKRASRRVQVAGDTGRGEPWIRFGFIPKSF